MKIVMISGTYLCIIFYSILLYPEVIYFRYVVISWQLYMNNEIMTNQLLVTFLVLIRVCLHEPTFLATPTNLRHP